MLLSHVDNWQAQDKLRKIMIIMLVKPRKINIMSHH